MHGFGADIGVSKGDIKAPPLSLCKYGAVSEMINVLSAPIILEGRSAPTPALKKGGPLPLRSF